MIKVENTMKMNHTAILPYLEIPIVKHCNLKCKCCSHLANMETENYADPTQFARVMARLSVLFSEITSIRLLGGEPLLHPELVTFAKIVRQYFPDTLLKIVTNGLLIPKLDGEILEELSKLNVLFDVSVYPPTKRIEEKIKARFYEFGIKFDLSPEITQFQKRLLIEPRSNAKKAWEACATKRCYILQGEEISYCCVPLLEDKARDVFGLTMDVSDSRTNIFEEKWTGASLLKFLQTPHSCCAFCGVPQKVDWCITNQPKPQDWVVDEAIE